MNPGLDPAPPALVRPHVDGPRAQDVPLAATGAPGRLLDDNPPWKLGKPHAYFGRDTLTAPRVKGSKFLPGKRHVEPRVWGRPPAASLVW